MRRSTRLQGGPLSVSSAMWAAATQRPYFTSLRALTDRVAVDRLLALSLGVAALGLNLLKLPGKSLWGDEVFSVELVATPWPVFWRFLSTQEANMALYHLFLRGWLGLTGLFGLVPDEVLVRIPSVVFGAVAVVVVFALGLRWWGRMVGTVAALLLMLNQLHLLASREARSYALEVLLVCLGWYALFAAMSSDRHARRWWSAFAIAMTLALYAHLFSALLVVAQAVAVAVLLALPSEWRDNARRSLGTMIAAFGGVGVAAVPLAVYTLRHGPTNPHIPPASVVELARLLWNLAGHDAVFGMVLGVAVAIAVALTARRDEQARLLPFASIIALLVWLIVPVMLSYAASQPGLNLHLFAWGYLVVVVPALCLLAGVGAAALRPPVMGHALSVALIVGAAFATPGYSSLPAQDFRTASAWITERYHPGDGLISTSWSSSLGMAYYARLGNLPDELLAATPAPWSWTGTGAIPLDMGAVAAYVATHPRVFLVDALVAGDAPAVKAQARAAEAWLDAHFVTVSEVAVPSSLGPVRVRLYETGHPAYL